jgi:hypothetical protein
MIGSGYAYSRPDEVEQLTWISEEQFKQELADFPEKYIEEMQDIARLFMKL